MDVPCLECDCLDCADKLQTGAAEVRPSGLLQGENGLFTTRDIKVVEWIASFDPMRQVAAGDGCELGYCIPIRRRLALGRWCM